MKKSVLILLLAVLSLAACRQEDNRPVLQPADIQSGVWTNCPEYTDATTQGIMMLVSEQTIHFAAFDFVEGILGDFQEQDAPRYSIREDGTIVCHVDMTGRDVRFAYIGDGYATWWNTLSDESQMDNKLYALDDWDVNQWDDMFSKGATIINGLFSIVNLSLGIASLCNLSKQSINIANEVLKNCKGMAVSINQLNSTLNAMFEDTKKNLRAVELQLDTIRMIQDNTERMSRMGYLKRTMDEVHEETDFLYYYSTGYALAADSIALANPNSKEVRLMEQDKLLSAWAGDHADYVERTKQVMDRMVNTRGVGDDVKVLTGMPAIYKQYADYTSAWLRNRYFTWGMSNITDMVQLFPSMYLSLLYCDVKRELYGGDSLLLTSYRADICALMKQMQTIYGISQVQTYFQKKEQQCLVPGCQFTVKPDALFPVDFSKLNSWDNDNGEQVYNLTPGIDPGVAQAQLLSAAEVKILADYYPLHKDLYTILRKEARMKQKVELQNGKTPIILLQGTLKKDKGERKAPGSGPFDRKKNKSSDYYPINDSRYQWYSVQVIRTKQ